MEVVSVWRQVYTCNASYFWIHKCFVHALIILHASELWYGVPDRRHLTKSILCQPDIIRKVNVLRFFDGLPLPCTTVNTNLGLGIKPGQIQHVMWNWKCLHSFLPTGLWRLGGLWCWGCSSWWLHFGFLATHTVWETEGSKSWNQGHGGIVPSSLRNERGQQMPCPREQHWHRLNLIMGSRSATSTGLINNVNHQPSLQ